MITMRNFLSLLTLLGLALGLHAQNASTSEACHGDHTVHASNSGFSPDHLTIHAGESVEFIAFSGAHDVDGITNVYTGEPFDNPQAFSLPPAHSFWFFGACIGTVHFDVPGTYHYNSTTTGNGGSITVLGDEAPSNTVVDIVVNSPVHNVLEAAVLEADLAGALSGEGPFTVFAPTDDAFIALAGALNATPEDLLALPELTDILLYHVVGATALSSDLSDGQTIATLNGADVTVTINNDGIFINDAQVTVADIVADNGVVHVIDAVLIPPTPEPAGTVVDIVVNSEVHNLLEAAVLEADLAETLSGEGPFTVFAPTDDAFIALAEALSLAPEDLLALPELADILLYHVVGATALSTDLSDGQMVTTLNGSDVTVTINEAGIFINDAQVIVADLVATNGVVHVIDAVLTPPVPTNTVVDIIVNSDIHTILEAAVLEADLAGALSGEGPFTVFAPTDEAFAALADALGATAADLLALPELADILLYHVVGATAFSTDLSDGQMVATLNGAEVEVSIECDGSIFINDAQVILADIEADNGVVHVLDAVLIPPTPSNACEDGGCCGAGTVWDPISQTCIAEDCHGDMNDDGFISIGDILMMLGFFGHDCE